MDVVLSILSSLHPEVDFMRQQSLVDDGILDSYDSVSIVAELDGELDVQIPAGELIPENFNSAQALFELVRRLMDE